MAKKKKNFSLEDVLTNLAPTAQNDTVIDTAETLANKLTNVVNITDTPKIISKKPHETTDREIENTPKLIKPSTSNPSFTNKKGIYTIDVGDICPHCKYGVIEEVIAFSGKTSEFVVRCPVCNAYIHRYKPMPHQKFFHEDQHQRKLYAGGFGSAKTYTVGNEVLAYVLQVPNVDILIGAATWGQASDTCVKFMVDNLPAELIMSSSQDKVNWHITLTNGTTIIAKALDKEGKIRSANLALIWVEEASEVSYEVIAYIMARLRSKNAFYNGKDRRKVLLSSNPDVGWLRENWLMVSHEVYYHGDVPEKYQIPVHTREESTSTHIAATSMNKYLPADYEANLAKNKPDWWVNRYLKGSFAYTEGLVIPNYTKALCEPFEIPNYWQRIVGIDFGRRDPMSYIIGAVHPITKVIYFYASVYSNLDDIDFYKYIEKVKKAENFPEYLLMYPRQGDPRGRNRDQVSGESWFDAYRKYNIFIQAAENMGRDSIGPSITKLYSYIEHGKLKIFKTLTSVIDDFKKYKYPKRTMGDDKNQGENPVDAYNHGPDSIRYAMAPLPIFPEDAQDYLQSWEMFYKKHRPYNPLSNDSGHNSSNYVVEWSDNFG